MGVPVDRGWAWAVVFGAFFNLLHLIGIVKALGILFVELMKHFEGSATSTAVLFSLLGALSLFSAPFTTVLAEIVGFRLFCMTGAVVACLGIFISSFGHSLPAVVYPFGIVGGLGIGMTLNPAPVIVAKYFDKKRALANGLVFTGSGIGGIIFPYIMHYILKEYSLKQALLILSGICLNCMVGAALYRPLSSYSSLKKPVESLEREEAKNNLGKENNCSSESLQSLDYLECNPAESQESLYFSALNLAALSFQDLPSQLEKPGKEETEHSWTFSHLLSRVRTWRRDRGRIAFIDCRLFNQPKFCFLLFGCFLGVSGLYVGMVTPAHCTEALNVTKTQAAVLLSVMGMSDTAGRLLVGFISDFSYIKARRIQFLSFNLLICSISCVVSVSFARNFHNQILFLLVFPFCLGGYIVLVPVVLADIVGINRLAKGWGAVLFAQGVSNVLSPLIIGAIRDYTGSYVIVYFVIGAILFIASSSMAMIFIHKSVH